MFRRREHGVKLCSRVFPRSDPAVLDIPSCSVRYPSRSERKPVTERQEVAGTDSIKYLEQGKLICVVIFV